MKIWYYFLFVLISSLQVKAEVCSRPVVKNEHVYFYKTISTTTVEVVSCLYNDKRGSYYDISENCLLAFTTGSYIDRNNNAHHSGNYEETLTVKVDTATVYPLKNEITLRSGLKCRYDRGFCYDPTVNYKYAVVWKVNPRLAEMCPDMLNLVFDGNADVWTFFNNLTYVFYYDSRSDRSFAVRLVGYEICQNKELWYIEDNNYVVSFSNLGIRYKPTKNTARSIFPLRSKNLVTEAVLKDCDLKTTSFNFNIQLSPQHFHDVQNISHIFEVYTQNILNNKISLTALHARIAKMETLININKTLLQHIQLGKYNVPANQFFAEILKKNKELESSLDVVKVGTMEMSKRARNFLDSINYLKGVVDILDVNNKRVEQNLNKVNTEMNQKFVTVFGLWKNNDNKNLRLEGILRNFDLKLETLRNTTVNCLIKVHMLKQYTDASIAELKKENVQLVSHLEKINLYILKSENSDADVSNMPVNFTKIYEKLFQIDNNIKQKEEDIIKFRKGVELIVVSLKEKYIELNSTVIEKLRTVESNVQNLTKLLNNFKENNNNTNSSSVTEIPDKRIQTSYNMSYIDDIISKKVNELKSNLNDKIKNVSNNVEEQQQNLADITNQVKILGPDKLTELEKRLTNKIEGVLKSEDTQLLVNKSVDSLFANITNILQSTESKIRKNILRIEDEILTESRIYTETVCIKNNTFLKEIEKINKRINKSSELLEQNVNRTISIENEIKNYVDSLNVTIDNNINDSNKKLEKLEKVLTNLPKEIENSILEKIGPNISSTINYKKDCDDQILLFKKDVSQKIIDMKAVAENLGNERNNNILNKIDIIKTKLTELEGTITKSGLKTERIDKTVNNTEQEINSLNRILKNYQFDADILKNQIKDLDKRVSDSYKIFDQLDLVNQTVANKVNSLQQEVNIIDNKVDGLIAESLKLVTKLKELFDKSKVQEETELKIKEQATFVEKLNKDVIKIKEDLNNQQSSSNLKQTDIETLSAEVNNCKSKQSENEVEVKALRKEITELRNLFESKEKVLTNSLSSVEKMLENKNQEIMEIKAEMSKLTSCCTENKKEIKQRDSEIQQLRNDFTKTTNDLKEEQEKMSKLLFYVEPEIE